MALDGLWFLLYGDGSQMYVLSPVYFGWSFRAEADSECVLQDKEFTEPPHP